MRMMTTVAARPWNEPMVIESLVEMRSFINQEHFRYKQWSKEKMARVDEVSLAQAVSLQVHAPQTALVKTALDDFRKFCEECQGVSLPPATYTTDHFDGVGITFSLRKTCPSQVDPLNPSFESFTLDVSKKGIHIAAEHERGILHGTHYIERLMADRGGPYVAIGRWNIAPRFTPRLTNSIFVKSDQDAGDPTPFDDEYLSLMSHYGANGIHLHMNLWDYCRNSILPELNSPDFDRRIEELNSLNAKMLRHGIDTWPILILRSLEAEHPVFHDVRRRGAPFKIQMADLADMPVRYVLCTGNKEVLACYEEILVNLFTAAPGLAGAWICVGGEGFLHCYSRPHGPYSGHTSCPHCHDKSPTDQVARLCNRLAGAVKRTGRHKVLLAHPYSAFTWSGNDRSQLKWIEGLSPDVSVVSNFDTGTTEATNDSGTVLYDYNITCVKGSASFIAQAEQLCKTDCGIYAKIESNTTADFFSLPYIPVHFRWHERYQAMMRIKVAGFIGQWRFYGMNASMPEDIQYYAIWNPELDAKEVLERIAQRDFETNAETTQRVISAWKKMSEAWDDYPYSAMTAGEREFYMRGPMHLGPAHPLIFNTQDSYRLSPKFRALRGDLVEGGIPDNYDDLTRNAKPRYVSELLLTLPYGVDRYLELLARCRQKWADGVACLKRALGTDPVPRARMEIDICEMTEIHLTTLENVVLFHDSRESLWRGPLTAANFKVRMDVLKKIVSTEIANAERSLPILSRDIRPGYGYCYGMAYDIDMVRDKLRQCRSLIDQELPLFEKTVRFHVWNEFGG